MLKYVLVLLLLSSCSASSTEVTEFTGDYIGCFKHQPASESVVPDMPLTINGTAAAHTVDNCLSACRQFCYRYAGILNGQFCMCGSMYGSQGAGDCTQYCYGNRTQICGSLQAVSVYATGYVVPGPPKNVTLNKTDAERVGLSWEPPTATNGDIKEYLIAAVVSQTYARSPLSDRAWTYPGNTRRAGLLGLSPGTQYNISLAAANEFGKGHAFHVLVWTPIREPTQPESPEVLKKDKGTITVKLKPVYNEYGPLSKYRVVVSSEPGLYFSKHNLKSWDEAQREGLLYYIAAELDPKDVTNDTQFVVGDGRRYSSYYNAPLPANGEFYVSLGVISEFQGLTKASYSSSTHSHNGIVLLDVPLGVDEEEENQSDGLATFLKAAIFICGLLLMAAIVAYVLLQRKYGRRRYNRQNQQELNIRGAVTEVENSAFVYDEYLPEEEERKVDYYDMLHQKIWNIPRNFLDLQSEIIGEGSFGAVFKGSVQQKNQVTPVAIYAIQDGELGGESKRNMLEGIDIVMRGGDNVHVQRLVGTCESQDTLYVVLEHHPVTLKDILLQSRSLQHSSLPKSHFCSLPESSMFQFMIMIAQGMSYLASKKIVHKQLTSSNIIMADGVTPKITGFGIADYSRGNKKPDYTRWSAHEVLSRRLHVTKSDVWSLGVLIWEVCALGGTPYGDVTSDQVAGAVLRGLRLPQLTYVGDSLYQLMLQCWQIDLDERPSFSEILYELESIRPNNEQNLELSFNIFRGFKYEVYSSELEHY